jgi:uncharacterized protein (TIGR02145 family)
MATFKEKYSNLTVRITEFSYKTQINIFLSIGFIAIMSFCKREDSEPPVMLTAKISDITTTSAISGGNITSDGGGEVTARGVCWNTNTNPTISNSKTTDGKGTGIFVSKLTDLRPGTLYYVKAYATNKFGTTYGFETSFTTIAITPSLTTTPASDITTNSVTSGGNITSDGGFEVTARGVCWSTSSNPTLADSHSNDGTGTGSYTSYIAGLMADTQYFIRAYAINSGGTAYGYQTSFTTYPDLGSIIFNPDLTYGSTSDIDGNIYKTIVIGSQTWMAENLRTKKLNDGTPLQFVPEGQLWNSTTPAYSIWYNGFYGAHYNLYVVRTGKLCPSGWHMPSIDEMKTLIDYLGGRSVAGGKLKEAGTAHWKSPNAGATNSSGFTALPGGYRPASSNSFWGPGYQGRWWESDNGDIFILNKDSISVIYTGWYCMGQCGMTVRCIKDQ